MAKPKPASMAAALGAANKGPAPTVPSTPEIMSDPSLSDILEDGPGLTLYLKRHSYEALKRLSINERKPVHALLVEAVKMLFESRGLSDSALAGNRPGSKKRTVKSS